MSSSMLIKNTKWILTCILAGMFVFLIYQKFFQVFRLIPPVQFFGRFIKVDPFAVEFKARISSLNNMRPNYQELINFISSNQENQADLRLYILYYEKMQRFFPDFLEVYPMLGFLYFYDGQEEKARESFGKALLIDSQNFLALYNLAVMSYKEGHFKDSIHYLEKASKVPPQQSLEQVLRSRVHLQIFGKADVFAEAAQKKLKLKYGNLAPLLADNVIRLTNQEKSQNAGSLGFPDSANLKVELF